MIAAAVLAYLVPNAASPVAGDGFSAGRELTPEEMAELMEQSREHQGEAGKDDVVPPGG